MLQTPLPCACGELKWDVLLSSGCFAELFSSPRPLAHNRTTPPELRKWLGLPKFSQGIGTRWRSCSTANRSPKAKDAVELFMLLWSEAGRPWYLKAIPLARSEETYAGSLRSGGTEMRSSYAFSIALERLMLTVSSLVAPHITITSRDA